MRWFLTETAHMARTGRPIAKLEISASERRELLAQLAVRKAPEDEKFRIRIVLACADGLAGEAIAKQYRTSEQTVSKWRRRYAAYRFAGLTDAPRLDPSRSFTRGSSRVDRSDVCVFGHSKVPRLLFHPRRAQRNSPICFRRGSTTHPPRARRRPHVQLSDRTGDGLRFFDLTTTVRAHLSCQPCLRRSMPIHTMPMPTGIAAKK